MTDIKELAIAVAFLEGYGAEDIVETTFSQEDRNLFYNWFVKEWDDKWDDEMIDYYVSVINNKIKELKGI